MAAPAPPKPRPLRIAPMEMPTARAVRRIVRLALRRRAFALGGYYVDRGGWICQANGGKSFGHILASGRGDLSPVGYAALLGAPLPLVNIQRAYEGNKSPCDQHCIECS